MAFQLARKKYLGLDLEKSKPVWLDLNLAITGTKVGLASPKNDSTNMSLEFTVRIRHALQSHNRLARAKITYDQDFNRNLM